MTNVAMANRRFKIKMLKALTVKIVVMAMILQVAALYANPISEAIKNSDPTKAMELIKANPGLIKQADTFQNTPLAYAVAANMEVVVHLLVDKGADINGAYHRIAYSFVTNKPTGSVIANHYAFFCMQDLFSFSLFKYFVDKGADIKRKDAWGRYLIHTAATHDYWLEYLQYAVSKGVDINVKDEGGRNALFYMADKVTLDYLLAKGLNINSRDNEGNTPLAIVAAGNNLRLLAPMLEAGADPRLKNNKGEDVLAYAVGKNFASFESESMRQIKNFLKTGKIELNTLDKSLLDAVSEENYARARTLLKDPAKKYLLNAQNEWGSTPLSYTVTDERNPTKVKFAMELMQMGARPDLPDYEGATALHWAVHSIHSFEILQFAVASQIKQKRGIDFRDKTGRTPLHRAVYFENIKAAELLLKNGADVHAASNEGDTPLHLIRGEYVGNEGLMVQLLLKYGAQIEARNKKGRTPFLSALCSEENRNVSVTAARALLKYGANIAAKDNELNNAYHLGVISDSKEEIIKFLSTLKISINDKNKEGMTPLQVARRGHVLSNGEYVPGSDDILKLLKNKGARD